MLQFNKPLLIQNPNYENDIKLLNDAKQILGDLDPYVQKYGVNTSEYYSIKELIATAKPVKEQHQYLNENVQADLTNRYKRLVGIVESLKENGTLSTQMKK